MTVKLTEAEAVEIRERYAAGDVTQTDLADEYGVGPGTIGHLTAGRTWPDAGGPITPPSTTNGAGHFKAKLTEADVVEARERYAAGGITQTDLADEYGISVVGMNRTLRGDHWAHAGGPLAEAQPHPKLTEAEVVEIRERYAAGADTQNDLAAEFDITQPMVGHLIAGRNWADAPGPIKGVDYDEPGQ